jgi:hypothetical protein
MRPVHLSLFFYDSAVKTLYADVSDLGPDAMHQVHPDSIDLGITIVSHTTGRQATFVIDQEHRSEDGELLHWVLIPADKSLRENDRLVGMTIKLFND